MINKIILLFITCYHATKAFKVALEVFCYISSIALLINRELPAAHFGSFHHLTHIRYRKGAYGVQLSLVVACDTLHMCLLHLCWLDGATVIDLLHIDLHMLDVIMVI